MSCGYDIHCLVCKYGGGDGTGYTVNTGLDWNHAGRELAAVLAQRDKLTDFGRLLSNPLINDVADRESGPTSPLIRIANFFIAHEGHELAVVDEYGRRWDRCGQFIVYDCGHKHPCVLQVGHEGDHTHKEPK